MSDHKGAWVARPDALCWWGYRRDTRDVPVRAVLTNKGRQFRQWSRPGGRRSETDYPSHLDLAGPCVREYRDLHAKVRLTKEHLRGPAVLTVIGQLR